MRLSPTRTTARLLAPAIDTLLALAPAAMFGIYARYPQAHALAWVTLVPWIVLYTRQRRPSLWLYAVGAWFGWLALYPQSVNYGWPAALGFATVGCLPWLPFAPALALVHRRLRLPRALSVPLLWVGVEWLRVALTPGHFALYLLGYSQAGMSLPLQLSSIAGVYGVSFLVAAGSGLLVDLLLDRGPGRARRTGRALGVAGFLGLLIVGYGQWRLSSIESRPGPRLALVQPNELHRPAKQRSVLLRQLLMSEREVEAGTTDLIVWPENAVLADLRSHPHYLDDLRWLAARKRSSLLVGAPETAPDGSNTNSAWLISPAGPITGRYDKRVLFPWSEYVPLDRWLGRVAPGVQRRYRQLVRRAWGFLPLGRAGPEHTLLSLPIGSSPMPFSVLICAENSYPPLASRAVRQGARFIVNITSEGEVGGAVQAQLLRISQLRAAETGAPYVRVGNTGISCIIDARGRLQQVLTGERGYRIFDAGVMLGRVGLPADGPSLYARSHGAVAGVIVAGAAVLVLLAGWRGRRRSTKESRCAAAG